MIFRNLKSGIEVNDEYFDTIYPKPLRAVSEFHFTPVDVAQYAARALVERPGTRVLDIGSGAGKFCLVGAACTGGHFTGVEQREHLFQLSEEVAVRYALPNVSFLHANIMDIRFEGYEAFYFFNAFYENINQENPVDFSLKLDRQLYDSYSLFVRGQLDQMPPGTKLATYFSYFDEIPGSYKVRKTRFDGYLKIWEKMI